jgi:hypothetical protein
MNNVSTNTANTLMETTTSETPGLVSLTAWATETDRDESHPSLSILRISDEPVYVSLFTDQGLNVATHYLDQAETWAGGYVYCLEHDCPACRAQINRKRFMLLPVADLTDSTIKILRVPPEKGAGKLLTEILKVLSLENRAEIVTKITRTKKYQYVVDAHRQDELHPDVAAAVKRFVQQLNAGVADLRSIVTSMPASEMVQHELVAKRLELEGRPT